MVLFEKEIKTRVRVGSLMELSASANWVGISKKHAYQEEK